MSRAHALAIGALALSLASIATSSSVAMAQHALPVDALAWDGLVVRSVQAPDTEALPVRIALGTAQDVRFQVDVWVAGTRDAAAAILDARVGSLSTLGLVPRSGFARARAFATAPSGSAGLVALAVENVVVIVRALDGDATPLAAHLVQAVLASTPPPAAALAAPGPLDAELTIQEPAGAVDYRVTCDGACAARRLPHAFCVTRTGAGAVDIALHVVDAFLRVRHVR